MILDPLICSRCKTRLPETMVNLDAFAECPSCGGAVGVTVFPALFHREGRTEGRPAMDDESTCYYHESKRAEVICDGCGRFLCRLCDIEVRGDHLCPTCIETALSRKSAPELESQYTHYDQIALTLAILPLVILPCAVFITSPLAMYYAIRHWRTPQSAVPRRKWRNCLALFFGIVGLAGGMVMAGFFALAMSGAFE